MRLAVLLSHPTQYYSPWFRYLAQCMVDGWRNPEGSGRKTEAGSNSPEDGGRTTGKEEGPRTGDCRPPTTDNGLLPDLPTFQPFTAPFSLTSLRVFYLWDFGVKKTNDPGFGKEFVWDTPLLEGYEHEFVPNVSKRPGTSWFGGLDNPGLLGRVRAFRPDVVLQFGYNYKSLVHFDLRWDTRRAPILFRGDSHLLADRGTVGLRASVSGSPQERAKAWVRSAALRFFFKRFAGFLAVGQANADYFRAHGVPEKRIVHCPHAVDNERLLAAKAALCRDFGIDLPSGQIRVPETVKRGVRRKLGLPEEALIFLFAGKFIRKKQPLELLEAFAAAETGPAFLLFVGNGELEERMREAVVKLGLAGESGRESEGGEVKGGKVEGGKVGREEEQSCMEGGSVRGACGAVQAKRVVFLPFRNQSEMPEVYAAADVLVLPSLGRSETWGLVVNEAACFGVPAVVSSHVGCGRDLIEEGVTGWSFPAGDSSALCRALVRAAGPERVGCGERLGTMVLHNYSFPRAAEGLMQAIALGSKRR